MMEPTLLETVLSAGICFMAFCFGITVGSFLNVCIYRLPKGESIIKSNSHCMRCRAPILKRDLIPLASWLILKGKCRSCGLKISPRYMLVEGLTGLLFALVFASHNFFIDGLTYPALLCIFIAFMVEIGFEDFDTKEMSVSVLLLLGIFAAVVRVLCLLFPAVLRSRDIPSLEDSLLGVTAVSVPLLLFGFVITPWFYAAFICQDRKRLYKIKKNLKKAEPGKTKALEKEITLLTEKINNSEPVYGFGMGDILLMAAGGLMLGAKAAITAAFAAMLLGALYAVIIIIKRRYSTEEISSDFAFGPFLAAGLIFAVFYGTEIFELYASSLVLEAPF
ncbi:MAG: prepilin peptidase [Oscillospiraceae bacterium]|nr:prepilin peptidase [Oscillospiraceae bacterium]